MSRGIGTTQQAILDALADTEYLAVTVTDLAERLGLPLNQTRRAARALETRGLVVITKECTGWRGEGEYGRLAWKRGDRGKDAPTAVAVREGEPIPHKPGWVASRDVEYFRAGMPTMGLLVWLPEKRIGWLENSITQSDVLAAALGGYGSTAHRDSELAELERLRERR